MKSTTNNTPKMIVGLGFAVAILSGAGRDALCQEIKPVSRTRPAEVVTKISASQLAALMKEEGYSFIPSKLGMIWKVDGFRSLVFVSDDGETLGFRACFVDAKATLADVNRWNGKYRYSRTFLNDRGHTVLRLDLDLDGGVKPERIADFLKDCRLMYGVWIREVVR